ncbi:related to nitrate assimilation regulatory protein nirA [Claviceps purpurea 20.1]|uniref:Related to nitrate assimilation regulatory protein nirA n=1 Tax=Claviceps purpurea (strain 20.1) TaxID=1111077 RepID=M1W4H1_CLAP2|nr:related to nitrate assimilation regulatory protein nirA [Claviceps purpurea 20.1]
MSWPATGNNGLAMSEHDAANLGKPSLRRLLPARGPRRVQSLAQKSPVVSGGVASASASERQTISEACSACRKHKTKCPGQRPSCSRCIRRKLQCHYTTNPGETKTQALKRNYLELRNQGNAQVELLELMRNLPEQDAHEVFQRVRTGADPGGILQHVKAGGVLIQMAVRPETRLRYEFPYRPEIPAADIPNNPYLKSIIYEAASLYPTTQDGEYPRSSGSESISTPGANNDSANYQSMYLKPFHAAEIVDARLENARCSLWTTVCSDDALMRDLLKVFFLCEYHYTAAFHKDYFLEDLVARRRDFCSPLLVNAVLAYACACYPAFPLRAEYWNPNTMLYRFMAEAKRIWELEHSSPQITTIQAGIIFNVIYNLCGLDEVGQPYRLHAVALARRMRLFMRVGIADADSRLCSGKAFTAWALYNWETLNAFSFMLAPLFEEPPQWPLPDPSHSGPSWYGEIWLKYPLDSTLSPCSFAHVIRSRCRFRVIMNDFCKAAYSERKDMSLERADQLHARLRHWYDTLPEPLQPKSIVLPGHLQLHKENHSIFYHLLILIIYEPVLHQQIHQNASTARQIIDDSLKYLQTLIRLYYLRHSFDAMDLFIATPLMLIASECVERIQESTPLTELELEALRSILILAAKGLYAQRRNHYLAKVLFRVIRGRMRESELALLKKAVHVDDDEIDAECDLVQAVRSHLPVTVTKKKENVDAHILKNLVENYVGLDIAVGGGVRRGDVGSLGALARHSHGYNYNDGTGTGMGRDGESNTTM